MRVACPTPTKIATIQGMLKSRSQRQKAVASRKLLTYRHIYRMVSHMKTTLNIDDTVMARLRSEAARRRCTMSELVESGLRLLFRSQKNRLKPPPLPTFKSGGPLVDIADRDALYQAMEGG